MRAADREFRDAVDWLRHVFLKEQRESYGGSLGKFKAQSLRFGDRTNGRDGNGNRWVSWARP